MRTCLPFWQKKTKNSDGELNNDEIHKLLIEGDFCNPKSKLQPYLNSEQFVLEQTFTANRVTLWHILACFKELSHVKLLQDLLTRYQDKITPTHLNRLAANGMSACHSAVSNANLEGLRLLVEHGADPTIAGSGDVTPLHLAQLQHYEDVDFIRAVEKIIEDYPKIVPATASQNEVTTMESTPRKRKQLFSSKDSKDCESELTLELLRPSQPMTPRQSYK